MVARMTVPASPTELAGFYARLYAPPLPLVQPEPPRGSSRDEERLGRQVAALVGFSILLLLVRPVEPRIAPTGEPSLAYRTLGEDVWTLNRAEHAAALDALTRAVPLPPAEPVSCGEEMLSSSVYDAGIHSCR